MNQSINQSINQSSNQLKTVTYEASKRTNKTVSNSCRSG